MQIITTQGNIIINDECPSELCENAFQALIRPKKFAFRTMVLCDTYDDEVRRDCQLALDGELIATPEELVIAQEILDKRLDVDAAQALLS